VPVLHANEHAYANKDRTNVNFYFNYKHCGESIISITKEELEKDP